MTASTQPLQAEALEGPKEGLVFHLGRSFGGCGLTQTRKEAQPNYNLLVSMCQSVVSRMVAYPGEAVVAPEMSFSDGLLRILLGQDSLLPLPFNVRHVVKQVKKLILTKRLYNNLPSDLARTTV